MTVCYCLSEFSPCIHNFCFFLVLPHHVQPILTDDKWLGVKVASEQQRKLLEDIVTDLRTYKDAGVHLQKWIAQKEKMVAVLGPVATEPSMIKNQLEQVKVNIYNILFQFLCL